LRDYVRGGGRNQTWNNIARWTEGIYRLNEDIAWKELSADNEMRRKRYLPSICAVNLKKTSGGDTSIPDEIYKATEINMAMLREQLSFYNPDIMICCGTSGPYSKYIEHFDDNDWKMTRHGVWYVRKEKNIFVSFSHPEARTRDSFLYYSLIAAIREIKEKL